MRRCGCSSRRGPVCEEGEDEDDEADKHSPKQCASSRPFEPSSARGSA